MYSTGIAYFLWFISGLGALGFHRFYLGKFGTGLLYMLTGGLGGIGSIYDLLTLPIQVREANLRNAYREVIEDRNYIRSRSRLSSNNFKQSMRNEIRKESLEQIILKTAKENQGIVTPSQIALEGSMSIDISKKALEKLVARGYADMRVTKKGGMVYFFDEFSKDDTHPDLEDF